MVLHPCPSDKWGTRRSAGHGPETTLGVVGRTANGRHWDAFTVSRQGKLRPEPLVGVTAKQIRYNFGSTGGEISGERTCKRRSAKHLEFVPSLFEGIRSIQLSYGRAKRIYNDWRRFWPLRRTNASRKDSDHPPSGQIENLQVLADAFLDQVDGDFLSTK